MKAGLGRVGGESAMAQIAEEALSAGQSILQELAGQHLETERLRREIRSEAAAWHHLFSVIPAACVMTDPNGFVLNANRSAGLFLNLAPKSLKGRELIVFIEDRAAFGAILQQVAYRDSPVQASVMIRPRERKPAPAQITAAPAIPQDRTVWLWFLIAASDVQPGISVSSARCSPSADDAPFGTSCHSIADEGVTCHRCGAITQGHHDSSVDCLETLGDEIRMLQNRIRYLRDRQHEFSDHCIDAGSIQPARTAASDGSIVGAR